MIRNDRISKSNSFASTPHRIRARSLRIESLEDRQMLAAFDVVVFSKTEGFRHDSIGAGLAAIEQLAADNEFTVTATENANDFLDSSLQDFEAVVFLNTTGNVFNSQQQAAFTEYIESGGGFVGIHSAADTEKGWSWYRGLVGATFESHPAVQQATIIVADQVHPSTQHLPDRWVRTDEWYNFDANPRGDVHVLATLDESTYSGGQMGADHPITWAHDYEGGRSWYTGLGHTSSTFSEPLYRQHLLGGIYFAAGQVQADVGATIESNFQVDVLDDDTFNPMELTITPDGRVIYIQRGGEIKIHDPAAESTVTAGNLSVYTGQEDGLLGIALDPDFASNGWIYLMYSPLGGSARQHVSRFTLTGDVLDTSSEQLILDIPTQRNQCCHSAGSIAFGPEGDLYIATGDDTNPFQSDGFAPIDERPGRQFFDAQRTSANNDDLRGKILRITPQPDGSYTIPAGNLFPADGSQGRPEIYIMGNRNPFRIAIDQQTGWLYWGDVGPDAANPNPQRGPQGYDEINQARQAGNYGWPLFVADNQPYRDYDFATQQSGPLFNPDAPVNDSPNNTGAQNLPPAQGAFIWYTRGSSSEFPGLGNGGRTSMAGPVYHVDAVSTSTNRLPAYYDDTLLIYEWSRGWVMEVKLDDNGDLLKYNPFLPSVDFTRPIDMEIGPDGAIYMLEWGSDFGGNNTDSQLIRIDYLNNPLPAPSLSGDYNGNGAVEQSDLDLVLLHWGDNASAVADDWINHLPTGTIDQNELDAVLLNWGNTVSQSNLVAQARTASQSQYKHTAQASESAQRYQFAAQAIGSTLSDRLTSARTFANLNSHNLQCPLTKSI